MTPDRSTMTLERIGKYRVTGELGRGGMGIVYRGEDPLIGRDVAIKTLTEVTPELRERFYLEARSGILSHPNIVTVYEVGEHEGFPFIAMEFIAGESLEQMLRESKRLPMLDAVSVVEQVCAGLGYAHGRGVVHRDVKPANIIVQPDGRVTIVDFGIARLADQTSQLTKTGALLGTFHYIAPERLTGEPHDGRADIWSTGIMLYEMLTGELPFKGKDIASLYRVIHESFAPVSDFVQNLPERINRVLEKALAKKPEDRYPTAEAMAFDLHLVADALRQDRVNDLLTSARRLTEEGQFASARVVLLQIQRIDPANLDSKALMNEVQDRLNHLQREEQLRQMVEHAQSALAERRWDDAIAGFQLAQKMNTGNLFELDEQLHGAQQQKLQQQKVATLWEQARQARSRGDLTGAQEFLGQALQIDENSTDLRNAYSVILREIRRKQKTLQVEELLRDARESASSRRYTEAIAKLREAAEIDPAHAEVQQLLFTTSARQNEERRQHLLEQIAGEIHESLDREDFDQAQDRVKRALEALPGDGLLLRLKVEADSKKRDFDTRHIVRIAVSQAQELFADRPEQALKTIENALEQASENDTLLKLKSHLHDELEIIRQNAARSESLVNAHAAIDATNYREAQLILQEAILAHGPHPDLDQLLSMATEEQAKYEQKQAELHKAAEIRTAVDNAVAACDRALADGDLRKCMNALNDVSKLHGENSVAAARSGCETRRRQKADQILRVAIESAQTSLDRASFKEAGQTLRKADSAAAFAGHVQQSEFQRMIRASGTGAKRNNTAISPNRGIRYVVASIVLIVAIAAIGLFRFRHTNVFTRNRTVVPASPAPIQTDLEINSSPWATIRQVQDGKGKGVALPGIDHTTPLRLDGLTPGDYKVTLADPEGKQRTVTCRVSSLDHLCSSDLGAPDLQQLLSGGQ